MGFKFTNLLSIATGYAYIFFIYKYTKPPYTLTKHAKTLQAIYKKMKKSSDLNVK